MEWHLTYGLVTERGEASLVGGLTMWKQATGLLLVCVLWSATPAFAQKVEIMGLFGWTLSDGVETDTAVVAGDGNIYDAIDTKDSA